MRSLLLCIALASLAALPSVAQDKPSLDGKWQVHLSIAGNELDQTCTFTQKDSELTGSCASAGNPTVNITGKVEENKVTWAYKTEYNGSAITVSFNGKQEPAGKIAGIVSVPEFSVDGEFTATLSK